MSSLDGVQVGDRVRIETRHAGRLDVSVRTVARVTKTQFTDDAGTRWMKSSGFRVGDSSWVFARIRAVEIVPHA
jgi:hypothetical protein